MGDTGYAGWLRRLSVVLAIVWMSVLFLLSATPDLTLPISGPGFDKIYHAGAYGLLAVLFLAALPPDAKVGYRWSQVGLAILLAGLYGLADEWHQSFVPTRTPDIWDFAADVTGATAGTLIVAAIVRRRLRIRFESREASAGSSNPGDSNPGDSESRRQ